MDIQQARRLKVGDRVCCPGDRGQPPYHSNVTQVNPNEAPSKNLTGVEFIWVEVKNPDGYGASLWPSNRISL